MTEARSSNRPPEEQAVEAAPESVQRKAQERLAKMLEAWERADTTVLCPVPEEKISLNEIRRISIPIYGITNRLLTK